VSIDFDGSFASEMTHSIRCSEAVDKSQRIVSFDPDELDVALIELDRLDTRPNPKAPSRQRDDRRSLAL
jgi:hypothetical protein